MKILFFTLMTTVFTMGCANGNSQRTPSLITNDENSTHQQAEMKKTNKSKSTDIYFAGGCFWGTEHFFKQIRGVLTTEVGYANGKLSKAPSYEQVSTGNTGFAETVKVTYNPQLIDLNQLLDLYFKIIDPTSLNKQGNDRGTQYRTGIYYVNETEKPLIDRAIATLAAQYSKPIVVEVLPLKNFYKAEEYHQAYLDKNPQGYCHISPALFEIARKANPVKQKGFKKPSQADLRKQLTPNNTPLPKKALPSAHLPMLITTSSAKVFMWILPPANPSLSLPISSNQAVAGQVSLNLLIKNS
ncbi:Peptide methionine sulfoxide reductase MsrA/MsrB [Capnocytophaga ochracea]|uniref:Peptide methionine sulfoxide reductase MsrA n=1 Tax=Capnocytophaga ochracea TaxID=1018 RepID=A0A2X2SR07_CAPOC|nr:Peptide methionine sulfoxide reductase MsrA/MsrB [Capnocytophaga ochracea]